jgi:hypothetical protein
MTRAATTAAAVLLAVSPVMAEDRLSLAGSGLILFPDTRTLDRGRAAVAFTLDNRDRDPLGLDVLDGAVAFQVGLAARWEAYGRAVLSRVVSMPEAPALPPPPLDLIVAAPDRVPPRPHYALYAPMPYVNHRGSARFDAWVPGDLLLGLTRRVRGSSGRLPAAAVAAEVTLPLTRSRPDLQSGAGTGGVDLGARVTAEWPWRPAAVVASIRYTRTGAPAHHDRVIVVEGTRARVEEQRLTLPDRIDLGLGLRRALGRRVVVAGEVSATLEVGARTLTLDARAPVDALAGAQLRLGRARLTAGLRLHGHAAPSGAQRPAPLAGFVDLTDVAPEAAAAYLDAVGAGGAAPALRAGVQTVLAMSPRGPLPPGARIIPDRYTIRSEHQVGYVLALGWSF